MVSPGLASKLTVVFLVEPQNQGGGGSPSLGLKTKQASVYRLRHKTDGGRSVRDTRRDLAVCLVWKQVWPEDGGGATTGGAHGTIVEVASEAS
jgi:ribosomal protein L34